MFSIDLRLPEDDGIQPGNRLILARACRRRPSEEQMELDRPQNWLRLVILPLIAIPLAAGDMHVYIQHLWRGNYMTVAGCLEALKFMPRVLKRAFNFGSITHREPNSPSIAGERPRVARANRGLGGGLPP